MRVSGGFLNGMTIASPKGQATRPTSAKVREALMSALSALLPGARVLDLFAGSGAISWEALSRGAAEAVLVDHAKAALGAIEANWAEAQRRFEAQNLAKPKIQVVCRPVGGVLEMLRDLGPFDIIWADPPYGDAPAYFEGLAQSLPVCLAKGGVWVLETSRDSLAAVKAIESQGAGWEVCKQRIYGNSAVHRLQLSAKGYV